ncbi:hypothetical protein E3N88_29643 [Mikania micrantha]|uniref:Uncharacterized protein n=1 Tax=Mikania micrantha TaxID=192012 RepID=A0A5N6MJL8_9ASTR|nr:hypothetical protein E3N88_29643 [Mikania micrantha]
MDSCETDFEAENSSWPDANTAKSGQPSETFNSDPSSDTESNSSVEVVTCRGPMLPRETTDMDGILDPSVAEDEVADDTPVRGHRSIEEV